MTQTEPVTTVLSAAEVQAAQAEVQVSLAPSQWWYLAGVGVLFWLSVRLGMDSAFMLVQQLPPHTMVVAGPWLSILFPLIVFLAGLPFINNYYIAVVRKREQRYARTLGMPDAVDAAFSLTTEGLRMETTRGSWLAKWDSIFAVQQTSQGWAFSSDLGLLFVPSRAFASTEIETAFVNAAYQRLSPAAQQRSPKAKPQLPA